MDWGIDSGKHVIEVVAAFASIAVAVHYFWVIVIPKLKKLSKTIKLHYRNYRRGYGYITQLKLIGFEKKSIFHYTYSFANLRKFFSYSPLVFVEKF